MEAPGSLEATMDKRQGQRGRSGEAVQPKALHLYFNAAQPVLSISYVLVHCKISLEKSAINSQTKNTTIRTVS